MSTSIKEAMPLPRVHPEPDMSAIDRMAAFLSEHYSREQFTQLLGNGSYQHLHETAVRLYHEHKERACVKTAFGRLLSKSEICHVNVFCLALYQIKKWQHSMVSVPATPLAG